jgi:hypothetical protein
VSVLEVCEPDGPRLDASVRRFRSVGEGRAVQPVRSSGGAVLAPSRVMVVKTAWVWALR